MQQKTLSKKTQARLFKLNLLFILGLSSCTHRYFYAPEIKGAGAIKAAEAAIDYSIPPSNTPELKMRVRSLGTEDLKDRKMFVVRMAFVRPKTSAAPSSTREFLRPEEQMIQLGLGSRPQIKPAFIYTKSRKTDVIELTGRDSGSIDLLFPIPKTDSGPLDMERILFSWKLHYANTKIEAQTARFNRYDAAPQQSAEPYPDDPDYPYDVSPLIQPGWELNPGPFWWPMVY